MKTSNVNQTTIIRQQVQSILGITNNTPMWNDRIKNGRSLKWYHVQASEKQIKQIKKIKGVTTVIQMAKDSFYWGLRIHYTYEK